MPESLDGIKIILNRRTREYEEFRTDALELASTLTPNWTDYYPHDPGVVLVEAFSGIADQLSYYIDRALHGSHWATAQTRRAYINMGELISYKLLPPASATVDVDVTVSGAVTLAGINSTSDAPLTVANRATNDTQQYRFELIEEFNAPAAGTYTLTFIEGRTVQNEILGSSNGKAGQEFTLGRTGITYNVDGSVAIKLEVFDGGSWSLWSPVENFIDSTSTDYHYTIYVDEENLFLVTFGDGTNGAIPVAGLNNVRVSYRIGGGPDANNLPIGSVSQKLYGPSIVTAVTNVNKPSGGKEKTTTAEAKTNGPKQYKTQDRAVTHKDYEAEATKVNGVSKAKAGYYNDVLLREAVYIAASGSNPVPTGVWNVGTQTGTGLLGAVGKHLNNKKCSGVILHILPMAPLTVEVDVDVYALPNYYSNDIKAKVETVIKNYITESNFEELNALLPLSFLNKIIEDIVGVNYVNVKKFHRKPYIENKTTGLANPTFSEVSVRSSMTEEAWIIFMQNATQFKVYGSINGEQSTLGTLGTSYTTDKGEVTFTITAGTNPNKYGDLYQILTSAYVGNVFVQNKEIPVIETPTVTVFGGIE